MNARPGRCVAFLGTGSDVGKSIVCTAVCRMLSDRGISVAPFKAQNMSNNSWVTAQGGEMGRAQVVQAEAARVSPHVDMNPVLLKPSADTGSQVILQGSVLGACTSADYWNDWEFLFGKAMESFRRLRNAHDIVVIEGAGSCAEVNLRDRDFVNFRMARAAEAPVILVADIDRGGVFAQIAGTLAVLPEEDKRLIKGFIVNRFRGDAALFSDGMKYLEDTTGLPSLGLVPYFHHIDIESEDGVVLDSKNKPWRSLDTGTVSIGVLKLPHISNFTDFNALQRDVSVRLEYLYHPRSLEDFDCLIIPGTKNVRFDIGWLREKGWEPRIRAFVGQGGALTGICGGYQMLGKTISDPHGIEGEPGEAEGFGFLDCGTVLDTEKILTRVEGKWLETDDRISGYEIHMGKTSRGKGIQPATWIFGGNRPETGEQDGARSEDGKIWGTYIHGIFDETAFRRSFVRSLREGGRGSAPPYPEDDTESAAEFKERQYDLLARHFGDHLDTGLLWRIIGIRP